MNIKAVKAAIAAAVDSADLTVNGAAVTCTAYAPDSVVSPHFFCADYVGNYQKTFGGLAELVLSCWVVVAHADDKSNQEALDELASSTDLPEAIRDARSSDDIDDLFVRQVQGPRSIRISEVEYYGLEFTVFVMG